jgi:hypothetical protein
VVSRQDAQPAGMLAFFGAGKLEGKISDLVPGCLAWFS